MLVFFNQTMTRKTWKGFYPATAYYWDIFKIKSFLLSDKCPVCYVLKCQPWEYLGPVFLWQHEEAQQCLSVNLIRIKMNLQANKVNLPHFIRSSFELNRSNPAFGFEWWIRLHFQRLFSLSTWCKLGVPPIKGLLWLTWCLYGFACAEVQFLSARKLFHTR